MLLEGRKKIEEFNWRYFQELAIINDEYHQVRNINIHKKSKKHVSIFLKWRLGGVVEKIYIFLNG